MSIIVRKRGMALYQTNLQRIMGCYPSELTNFASRKSSKRNDFCWFVFYQETVERRGLLVILMDTLHNLKDKANTYTSKAALGMSVCEIVP